MPLDGVHLVMFAVVVWCRGGINLFHCTVHVHDVRVRHVHLVVLLPGLPLMSTTASVVSGIHVMVM